MIKRQLKLNTGKQPGPAALRLWLLAIALLGLAISSSTTPVAPAHAQDGPERSAVNSDLTIDKDEVVDGDVSVTNGNLVVYGVVHGNAAVVNGSAQIDGRVDGDVVVVGGDISLGPGSTAGRDVASLGGKISRDPAAKVGGVLSAPGMSLEGLNNQVHVVAAPPTPVAQAATDSAPAAPEDTWFDRLVSFFVKGLISLTVLVIGLVVASAVPERVRVAGATLEAEPVPSLIVGLIVSFLLVPVVFILAVVLAISLVGIVLLPVLAVAAGVAWLFGLVTLSSWLGRRVYEAMHQDAPGHGRPLPVPLQVLMGLAVVLGATFLPMLLIRGPVPVLMGGIIYFAACIGLGAAILSRFGTLAPPARPQPPGQVPVYRPPYPPPVQPQPERRGEESLTK
jgi:hypothetical protein